MKFKISYTNALGEAEPMKHARRWLHWDGESALFVHHVETATVFTREETSAILLGLNDGNLWTMFGDCWPHVVPESEWLYFNTERRLRALSRQ